jgi:enamine deaminase RidA (YjgF/YER057c/UK114 family)
VLLVSVTVAIGFQTDPIPGFCLPGTSARPCGEAGAVVAKSSRAAIFKAGSRPEHVVRFTWYVVDKKVYLVAGRDLGAAYRRVFGKHYLAMSAVQVVALIEGRARVEIEATAVIPVA